MQFTFTLLALATLAVASPLLPRGECDTGSLQCCDQVQSANSTAASKFLGTLGIPIQNVDGEVGLGCSPITAIGVGQGGSCSAKPVCCTDNSHGNLISLGCLPVSL